MQQNDSLADGQARWPPVATMNSRRVSARTQPVGICWLARDGPAMHSHPGALARLSRSHLAALPAHSSGRRGWVHRGKGVLPAGEGAGVRGGGGRGAATAGHAVGVLLDRRHRWAVGLVLLRSQPLTARRVWGVAGAE